MWLVCLYSYNIVMEDEIIIKKSFEHFAVIIDKQDNAV